MLAGEVEKSRRPFVEKKENFFIVVLVFVSTLTQIMNPGDERKRRRYWENNG